MFNPFSALTSKIFGGGLIAMALVCAYLFVDRNQWRATARKEAATLALVKPAQDLALAKAKQAIAATEARYKEHANDADQTHIAANSGSDAAATRFIDAHRVPVCSAGGAASGTLVAAGDSRASVPASVPTDTLVAVSDTDVRACSAAATYARDAHDWAVGLGKP